MTICNDETRAAHQRRHGSGELSDSILASRIAAGWSAQEIATNQKPLGPGLVGADDDDDQEAYRLARTRKPKGYPA